MPKEARWAFLPASAKQPTIGKTLDHAMLAVERDNPSLKSVLPKDYAHPRLDKQRLGDIIDMIGNIGLGDKANRSKDILRRVYEYFLSQFASAEGKKGGQFYTPRCIVQLLVEMLTPYKGRSMTRAAAPAVCSCSRRSSWRPTAAGWATFTSSGRNRTIPPGSSRDEPGDPRHRWEPGPEHADSFHRDLHPDLKADYVLANPPFNDSDWRGELLRDDKRWQFGTPPAGNANYAWVQHFIHHLAPAGTAGFVLANGSMSSNQSGEGESARRSSRPTWWIAWSRCPASFSTPPRSPSACGSSRGNKRRFGRRRRPGLCATAAAKSSSSTPASSAR